MQQAKKRKIEVPVTRQVDVFPAGLARTFRIVKRTVNRRRFLPNDLWCIIGTFAEVHTVDRVDMQARRLASASDFPLYRHQIDWIRFLSKHLHDGQAGAVIGGPRRSYRSTALFFWACAEAMLFDGTVISFSTPSQRQNASVSSRCSALLLNNHIKLEVKNREHIKFGNSHFYFQLIKRGGSVPKSNNGSKTVMIYDELGLISSELVTPYMGVKDVFLAGSCAGYFSNGSSVDQLPRLQINTISTVQHQQNRSTQT